MSLDSWRPCVFLLYPLDLCHPLVLLEPTDALTGCPLGGKRASWRWHWLGGPMTTAG